MKNGIIYTPASTWTSYLEPACLDPVARSRRVLLSAYHPLLSLETSNSQERFLPDLLTCKKRACIAITEPSAGSDVANIQTTAVKSKDGKHYIVNGQKKWITNGIWADVSAMAVRTGGPGGSGLSMLVVPLKGYPGVTMRRLKVGGQISAGTTFIELDDVKVPVENLIGTEGMGMKYVMTNFNHERLTIASRCDTTSARGLERGLRVLHEA